MKKLCLLLCLAFAVSSFAQTNLNAYKYVIVPKTFGFLKEENQYKLNALTEFLFNKYGFVALMEDSDMPADLNANGCLALRSNVLNESSLFTTKLKVELKDCKNQLVFSSKIGSTKEKEFEKAYQLALREAFESVAELDHQYDDSLNTAQQVAPPVAPVAAPVAATPVVANTVANTTPVQTDVSQILYAQAITNGYQLVDSTPKVVYKLKQTNTKDVFLVEGQQAMVRKDGDVWVLEYYEGDALKTKTLNIKF